MFHRLQQYKKSAVTLQVCYKLISKQPIILHSSYSRSDSISSCLHIVLKNTTVPHFVKDM